MSTTAPRSLQPPDPVRILLIDDDEDDYELTRGVVGQIRSFRADLRWEKTYDSGLAALGRRQSDVCLLDYHLGAKDGLELLADARHSGWSVPIIFLTGHAGPHTDASAMRGGADDYLAKADLTASTLERSIRYALERAQHVEELRRSEQLYRRIVESTVEGVYTSDARGRVTFVNAQMATMLGRDRSDLVGKPCETLLGVDPVPSRVAMPPREVRIARRDGSDLWVWLHSQPLFDSAGRYEGVLALVTDITEKVRTDAALRGAEEQLRQSQKMEAIGALAGGVAHDFNNLLSVILSYAEMMRAECGPDDPRSADLEEIEHAGHRARELTAQLLAFGRKQMLKPRVVDVCQVVGGLEKMLRRVLKENITLTLALESSGTVFVDPSQVEQTVLNLAVNAADAMPAGGELSIETSDVNLSEGYAAAHPGVTAGPHVLLSVNDTGVGIPRDIQPRVFEPFFTTKEMGKGTGLGLATVFGIVKQSGGHIALESEPGKGSRFLIFFPTATVPAAQPVSVSPAGLPTATGRETVLLVEDEDQVRHLMRALLRRGGYTVLEARNAGEALLIAEHPGTHIDLLLTDVVMPRMGGREMADRLRVARPGLKVLFVSGYADAGIVHGGVVDPGVHLLAKPITPGALLTRVRETLDAPDAV